MSRFPMKSENSLTPKMTSCTQLLEFYECILLDAYGVLVKGTEALPYASEFINFLNQSKKPYFILSNGSRQKPEIASKNYHSLGLNIACDKIITSGSLVESWINIRQREYNDFKTISIIGPPESYFTIENTDAELVSIDSKKNIDGIIITNQDGFPFIETMNRAISKLFKAKDKGYDIPILLPNPDLIYPDKEGSYGITSGMVALILEKAFQLRYPGEQPIIHRLGKPYMTIFDHAKKLFKASKMVMIGDQIATDIKGANNAGIDSVLINTGINSIYCKQTISTVRPTYILKNLQL